MSSNNEQITLSTFALTNLTSREETANIKLARRGLRKLVADKAKTGELSKLLKLKTYKDIAKAVNEGVASLEGPNCPVFVVLKEDSNRLRQSLTLTFVQEELVGLLFEVKEEIEEKEKELASILRHKKKESTPFSTPAKKSSKNPTSLQSNPFLASSTPRKKSAKNPTSLPTNSAKKVANDVDVDAMEVDDNSDELNALNADDDTVLKNVTVDRSDEVSTMGQTQESDAATIRHLASEMGNVAKAFAKCMVEASKKK